MEQLIAKARELTTDQIEHAVVAIGGGHVDKATRMARAALIEVYKEREGEDAADRLMDAISL